MDSKTALIGQETTQQTAPMALSAFSNAASFEAAQRMAKALVTSNLVPQHLQGPDKIGDAIIVLEMAQRINASPLMVAQNLYVVHGSPAWSAKFLIATFNQSGKYTSIQYEWKGEKGKPDHGCRAVCIEKATGNKIEGPWITWELVKAEGWDAKKGSKWKTMPDKMFQYRAAAWMIDVTAPEISMGLPTADNMEDIGPIEVPGEVVAKGDDVRDALTGDLETKQEQEKQPAKKKAAKKKPAPKPEPEPEPEPEQVDKPESQQEAFQPPTYAEIANGIHKAQSKDDLDAYMDQAGHLPPEQVDELATLANGKMAEFQNA